MRKKLLSLVVAAISLGIVAVPAIASAASTPPPPPVTDIYGTVSNNGKDVNNAKVTVICNNHVQKTTTDSSGYYIVGFSAKQCPIGASVSVTATKGGKGGESNGKVFKYSDDLNIDLVNVSLPEFGLVAGTAAAVLGGGAFLFTRRRHLSGHQA